MLAQKLKILKKKRLKEWDKLTKDEQIDAYLKMCEENEKYLKENGLSYITIDKNNKE